MRIEIPDFCLVALIGPSGSGKSHLAQKLFGEDEILSSDYFRKLVSGDQSDQGATEDAFECLYNVAGKRMDRRKLTVIDATNLNKWARSNAIQFAKEHNCFCIAIALNIPEKDCLSNNTARKDRQTGETLIKRQCHEIQGVLKSIKKESFRQIHVINSLEEANNLEISRIPLWPDRSTLHGPFDIIGDVHGCYAELCDLLRNLGYQVNESEHMAVSPNGRKAIFLGDLCDRGPENVAVLRLAMNMTASQYALCVPGNHDDKLLRHLDGKKVQVTHGLENTLAELERENNDFIKSAHKFLRGLVSHYLLDDGKLVVCHAGLPKKLQGRSSQYVREFCLYGDPSGNLDEYGLPERNDWARDYDGHALVAYGHCPDPDTRIVNNTICLDGGCVFGGHLAALRYPEMEIVSVAAKQEYYHSPKPLTKRSDDSLPDVETLLKRQRLETNLGVIVIRDEERSLAALEIMGRFTVDPHWLIYLPPTMSPCESSALPDYLEHPVEALNYYRTRGVKKVICQEKHMGSRAIIIICKDAKVAEKKFLSQDPDKGIIYTRTGRPFFNQIQKHITHELLSSLRDSLTVSRFWSEYGADWVCLDCEIMPWSFKANSLISSQYAPYGLAAMNGLDASIQALDRFNVRMKEALPSNELESLAFLRDDLSKSKDSIRKYNTVWQSYCSPVSSLTDIKIAPFHILATEGRVWSDVSHDNQLNIIEKHFSGNPCFMPTRKIVVDLDKEDEISSSVAFWEDLLAKGGEGMVVKPLNFIPKQGAKLIQPAIKCRGREYLRIIYGAEYLDNLEKLKNRNLAGKRKRAINEFALGLEALNLFVRGEPFYKVHECVFTIMALESEPQDARL